MKIEIRTRISVSIKLVFAFAAPSAPPVVVIERHTAASTTTTTTVVVNVVVVATMFFFFCFTSSLSLFFSLSSLIHLTPELATETLLHDTKEEETKLSYLTRTRRT